MKGRNWPHTRVLMNSLHVLTAWVRFRFGLAASAESVLFEISLFIKSVAFYAGCNWFHSHLVAATFSSRVCLTALGISNILHELLKILSVASESYHTSNSDCTLWQSCNVFKILVRKSQCDIHVNLWDSDRFLYITVESILMFKNPHWAVFKVFWRIGFEVYWWQPPSRTLSGILQVLLNCHHQFSFLVKLKNARSFARCLQTVFENEYLWRSL